VVDLYCSIRVRRTHTSTPPYMRPYIMKKTGVYLDEAGVERLRALAAREQRSQAQIIGAAIVSYEPGVAPNRHFALAESWEDDGTSVADVTDDELLQGFCS
jgi:hypothetical protein